MTSYRRPIMALLLALLTGCSSPPEEAEAELSAPAEAPAPASVDVAAENERVILEFMEAWSRLDPVELASYFTEDGVYDNVPTTRNEGRVAVQEVITGITQSWDETVWEVTNVVASGNLVMVERVDRTRAGDKSVNLPVVGVFEMEEGKIKEWRDYFDVATFRDAMR